MVLFWFCMASMILCHWLMPFPHWEYSSQYKPAFPKAFWGISLSTWRHFSTGAALPPLYLLLACRHWDCVNDMLSVIMQKHKRRPAMWKRMRLWSVDFILWLYTSVMLCRTSSRECHCGVALRSQWKTIWSEPILTRLARGVVWVVLERLLSQSHLTKCWSEPRWQRYFWPMKKGWNSKIFPGPPRSANQYSFIFLK